MKEVHKDNFGDRVFNSKEIKFDGNALFEPKTLSVFQIIESLAYLDTDPPYQRGIVWKNPFKQELIRSILRGIPINTLHFVEKSNSSSHFRWVLDGKQRIETLRGFVNNKFSVKIIWEGSQYELYWRDITNPEHPCHILMSKIKEFQINVVIWKPMAMEDQRDVFIIINYSKSLNNDEKLYCEHFVVQKLLKFILEESFENIKDNLNKKIVDDYRFAGVRMLHSLILLNYGYNLDDQFAPRALSAEKIRLSCKSIESIAAENNLDASMTIEAVKNVSIFNNIIEDMRTVTSWFVKIIDHRNDLKKGKKFEHNLVVDLLVLFLKKKNERVLTTSYVEQNLDKMLEFVLTWVDHKNEHADRLKKRTTDPCNVKARFDELEIVFDKSEIDASIKNRAATQREKLVASLQASSECPITGSVLCDKNVQYDHLKAAATTGDPGKIVAISDVGNRRKSDNTLKTIQKTEAYMETEMASL